jgi:hypothetical protein
MGKDVNGIVIVGVYFGFDVLKELIYWYISISMCYSASGLSRV